MFKIQFSVWRILKASTGPFLPLIVKRVRTIAKSFVMSLYLAVRPHATTRLPLDGFSWNLVFEYFSKICSDNTSSIKILQE